MAEGTNGVRGRWSTEAVVNRVGTRSGGGCGLAGVAAQAARTTVMHRDSKIGSLRWRVLASREYMCTLCARCASHSSGGTGLNVSRATWQRTLQANMRARS